MGNFKDSCNHYPDQEIKHQQATALWAKSSLPLCFLNKVSWEHSDFCSPTPNPWAELSSCIRDSMVYKVNIF